MAHSERQGLAVTVNQTGDWPLPERLLEHCIRCVWSREGISVGELSVTFLTDQEIHALNLEYLGEDRPTDVIAFALHGSGEPPLGDVYVGYEQARRHAREEGIEVDEELLRLAIHGTLHVFGHDHPEGDERTASEMFQLQEEILQEVLSRP